MVFLKSIRNFKFDKKNSIVTTDGASSVKGQLKLTSEEKNILIDFFIIYLYKKNFQRQNRRAANRR